MPGCRARRRGPSGLLAEDALIAMIGQVREAVSAARRSGRFPLLIGGTELVAGRGRAHCWRTSPLGGADTAGSGHRVDLVPGRRRRRTRQPGPYPALFAELFRRGWTEPDCAALAGGNLLRVMRAAESYAVTAAT